MNPEGNRYSEKGSKMKEEMESNILGARTRGQLKKEKEKFLSDPASPIRKESIDDLEVGSRDSLGIGSRDVDTLDDSTDSYVQNEATIVWTCIKKLPNINEESLEKMTISPMIKLREEAQDDECSDEYLSSEEQEEAQDPQAPIINLISQLEKEKEEINSKLTDLLHRQQSFDAKWNQLNQALNSYFDNVNNASKKKSKVPLKKPKHFKVICTKARRSIMSPSASLALSKSSKTEFKNFGDLKENFSCLKTPNQSVKKVHRFKKSVCYTPNSLSVLVGDQVKDIFGEM